MVVRQATASRHRVAFHGIAEPTAVRWQWRRSSINDESLPRAARRFFPSIAARCARRTNRCPARGAVCLSLCSCHTAPW